MLKITGNKFIFSNLGNIGIGNVKCFLLIILLNHYSLGLMLFTITDIYSESSKQARIQDI